MALKLDINKDTLIPSQAFKDWAKNVLTDEGIRTSGKNFFTRLGSRSKDLQKRLKELKQKIDACPAGSDAWFSKMFLWPFGGTVTADAKEYFNELGNNGDLDVLERAAGTAITLRQTNGTQLAAACAAAIALVADGPASLPAVVGKLAVALTTTAPPPPPPPPTGGTLDRLKAKLLADPSLFSLFTPPLQAGNIASMKGDKILAGINAARRIPAKKVILDPVLIAAGYNPAAMPTTLTEQLEYFGMSELVESGKITLEDYNRLSNRLLRTPLNETPEAAAAIAAHKAKFDGFASSISANCTTLAAELKGLQTLGQNLARQTMVESLQTQVLKAHIKKRILQETANKDSREQLNEFFLIAALLAALTGAIAWATSKIADFFKDSEYGNDHRRSTYPPRETAEAAAKEVQALGASLIAGYGPNGVLVDAAGKRVAGKIESKETVIAQLDFSIKNIVTTLALLKQIKTEASTPTTPPPATALSPAAALAVYLGVAATDVAKIALVNTALAALAPYEVANAGPINIEIGKVKTALDKV